MKAHTISTDYVLKALVI